MRCLRLLSVAAVVALLTAGCGQGTWSGKHFYPADPVVTERDSGHTLDFEEGQQIWFVLRAPGGYEHYSIPKSTDLTVIGEIYRGAGDPMFGVFGPGKARLTSRALPQCPGPACEKAARDWTIDVRIKSANLQRNTWIIRVPDVVIPDIVRLRLRARDSVEVMLTSDWTQPVSSDTSILATLSTSPSGHWWAPTPFAARKGGNAEITSRFDPACFHTVPHCALPDRTTSVQVSIVEPGFSLPLANPLT